MATITSLHELHAVELVREQGLEEGRVIQGAMLPSQPLHADKVLISHEFRPLSGAGGDDLDYFTLSDNTIGLYVGDVSGEGPPAALYRALAVGTLCGVHHTGTHPARVLSLVNERLHLRGIPGRHSAAQYAVFYPTTSKMIISSAGMPGPLLLLRGKDGRSLQLAGIPSGLLPEWAMTNSPGTFSPAIPRCSAPMA